MPLGHGVMYGVQASFLSEMFPSNVRCSGASLGYQLAAPFGGGIVPALATAMVGVTNMSTWPVSVLMILFALVTILTVRGARETSALANARSQARLLQGVG
jgi:MFS transporter, MHS family, shikimate and dehydroshikimate transport protein